MVDIVAELENLLTSIIDAIPAIILAIIILILGYVIGIVVGKAVNRVVERMGVERAFEQTSVGRSFNASGLDLSNLALSNIVWVSLSLSPALLAREGQAPLPGRPGAEGPMVR